MTIERLGIAVYNEMGHRFEFASSPRMNVTPEIVQQCFDCQSYLSDKDMQALPLLVDAGGEHQCVGVLYLERQEESMQEADRLLFQLISRYVGIVVLMQLSGLLRNTAILKQHMKKQEELHGKTVCCMYRTWY